MAQANSIDLNARSERTTTARMLEAFSFLSSIRNGDLDHPAFTLAGQPRIKILGDNPDCLYHLANLPFSPGRVYRVRGAVPGTPYFSVAVYAANGVSTAYLSDKDIEVEGGQFKVALAGSKQAGNWLDTSDLRSTTVIVRQYVSDWQRDRWIVPRIEVVETGEPLPQRWLSKSERRPRAKRQCAKVLARTEKFYDLLRNLKPTNQLLPMGKGGGGAYGTFDVAYWLLRYTLEPDETLEIKGSRLASPYWSFCLYDYWFRSFDYAHHTISLNHTEIEFESDDRYALYVGPRDPGRANWLDTLGHRAGLCILRLVHAEPDPLIPETAVVRLGDVASLPGRNDRSRGPRMAAFAELGISEAEFLQAKL